MAKTISATKFKAQCLQIMDDVQLYKGQVLVTKYGKPVVKLVPVEVEKTDSLFGSMKGSAKIVGDIISPLDIKWNAEEGLF